MNLEQQRAVINRLRATQKLSNQQKMLKHLFQAESADAWVAQIEDDAEQDIGEKHPRADLRRLTYYMKTELAGNSLYTVKGGSRNYNVAMATMYALAAILERTPEPNPLKFQEEL